MPRYVTRKKLSTGAIFDLECELWGVWSSIGFELKKKKLNKKAIQAQLDLMDKVIMTTLEIRMPDQHKGERMKEIVCPCTKKPCILHDIGSSERHWCNDNSDPSGFERCPIPRKALRENKRQEK